MFNLTGFFILFRATLIRNVKRVKMELIKLHGIDPFELLGKCPEKYHHLLPEERQ